MQRLVNVHPSDITQYPNGSGRMNIGAADDGSKVLMYNETPLNIDLDFLNGQTDVLHAWEANYWTVDADTKEIDWVIDTDSLNVTTPPVSAIFITLYGPNETLRDKTYPQALVRQASVGNAVTTTQGQTLNNTTNASGSNVVTVGSTAVAGNTWDVSNDGLWDIAVTISNALVKIFKTFEPGANGTILQLGAATYIAEILGNLLVDGTATVSGVLTAISVIINTINSQAATNLALNTPVGQSVIMENGGVQHIGLTGDGGGSNINELAGVDMFIKASVGKNIKIGTSATQPMAFNNVGMKGLTGDTIARFGSASASATGTVTHSLGAIPDFAAIQTHAVGSQTTGYDSETSTQLHVTLGAALATFIFLTKRT